MTKRDCGNPYSTCDRCNYEAMLEQWRHVSRGMNKVRELYRQGKVTDSSFLAARTFFNAADEILTATETAYAS